MILLATQQLVMAQTPSEELPLDTTLILAEQIQIYFPTALQVDVTLATRTETVTSGSLTLFQTSGYQQVIEFDVEADVNTETIDTVAYTKQIIFDDPNDAPAPFEPINYRIDFITDTARTERVGEVLFQPNRGVWQQRDATPFIFYWHNPALGIPTILDNLTPVYDLLQQHTARTPQYKFVLYDNDFMMCDTITTASEDGASIEQLIYSPNLPDVPCSKAAMTAYFETFGIALIQPEESGFAPLENALIDFVVQDFYAPLWNDTAPEWFMIGLGQFYRQSDHLRNLVLAQTANQQRQLLPYESLKLSPIESQEILWKAQSYLLLSYLADTFGAEMPFIIARSISQDTDFAAALTRHTELTEDMLYRGWVVWLQTPEAEKAVSWNPYLPDTPTPTTTPSDTPVPPTPTITNTPTVTITPSSTSLIGRLPTQAAVQNSPIPPTIRPTITNTPLPAGSFNQPTETPPPPEDASGGLPCGASAAIAPMLGIAWLHRRRQIKVNLS